MPYVSNQERVTPYGQGSAERMGNWKIKCLDRYREAQGTRTYEHIEAGGTVRSVVVFRQTF